MQRNFLVGFTFVSGAAMIISFFMPVLQGMQDMLNKWAIIVSSFSLLLGMGSILMVNIQKISRKHADAPYAVVLLIALFTMMFLGIFFGVRPGDSRLETINLENLFDYLFQMVMMPMSSTMFSLLAFFVASAAYRAFRARTPEATLLLVAAFIVMLGQVPIGNFWIIPQLKDFIMETINTAGQRAIMIGAALGVVAVSLRILLGIERPWEQ
jgi:hypothetical protein